MVARRTVTFCRWSRLTNRAKFGVGVGAKVQGYRGTAHRDVLQVVEALEASGLGLLLHAALTLAEGAQHLDPCLLRAGTGVGLEVGVGVGVGVGFGGGVG